MSRWRRSPLVLLASLAFLAAAVAAAVWLTRPAVLTIAVPAHDPDSLTLLEALARAPGRARAGLDLRLLRVDGLAAAARALDGRAADLAVVRPDLATPASGMTVAILREDALVLAAPASARLDGIAALQGKRIGLLAAPGPDEADADERLLAAALAAADLAPPAVTLVRVPPGGEEAALREKRIDALARVGPVNGTTLKTAFAGLSRAANGRIVPVDLGEAEALAAADPALATASVAAGALGSRPRRPEEEMTVPAVTRRLVARADVDPGTVASFAEALYESRPRLAQATPAAKVFKAPEAAMGAALPVHPGAIQYLERERLTFFERYGDWIYIGLFMGGGFFSALAAGARRITRKRRELVDEVLDRLLCLPGEAREAEGERDLDRLSVEIDGLVTHAVRYSRHRTTGIRTLAALTLAIDAARQAVSERRRTLEGGRPVAG